MLFNSVESLFKDWIENNLEQVLIFLNNPAFNTDSYKLSHKQMEPDGTETIYANLTPRFNKYFKLKYPNSDDKVVNFGLQYFLIKELIDAWSKYFFQQPLEQVMQQLELIFFPYIGMDKSKLSHFEALHKLGYLPLRIKALPEGTVLPLNIPLITIENTHKSFSFLTNYVESVLSLYIHKPITVATIAREFSKLTDYWFDKTVVDHTFKKFTIHDFSLRGHDSVDAARICGAAALLYSNGTDNVPGYVTARTIYGGDDQVAFSVAASEHSVTTLGINFYKDLVLEGEVAGLVEILSQKMFELNLQDEFEQAKGELITIYRLLTERFPTGLLSYVADSYDYWRVITIILPILKDVIMRREGKLVIRPDCYSSDTEILTNRGFIFFKDLTTNDLVAQVLDDGTYEFVIPLKIVNEQYKGKMYHFKDHHGKVDQLVTPNHRMIYKQINSTDHSLITEKVVFAEDMKNQGNYLNYFERSAKAQNKGKSLTPLERLNIAFQADGSYTTGCNNSIRFSFSKQRKIDRLTTLLTESSIPFKIYDLADGKKEFNISLSKEKVLKDFSWVDISDLCSNWCSEFIEELKHWDSSIRSEDRFKYDTTTESCSKVVELIALSAGKGVLTSRSEDNRKEHFSEIFTTHIMDNNKCGGQSWSKEEVDYEGTIHCVQVPTGRLVVKRNRSIIVCGNSGDPVEMVCGLGKVTIIDTNQNKYRGVDPFRVLVKEHSNTGSSLFYLTNQNKYYLVENLHDEFIIKEVSEEEAKGSIEILSEIFGYTTNDKGYKELPPQIGLIYGDGITYQRSSNIFENLALKAFASSNIVLGVGLI